ncbi:hypothetical protein AB0E66_06840, partial [Streptomyces sp. NPDC033753]|uniref:hypothetical protein n=2 Tax=unclassified Streptomyces TaxID=2593676 RepID=UPI0033C061EF
PKMDGVSTNLALIFGTLLSSQGADASFVLTLAGFPPGFSFVLAFPTLSDLSDPISSVLSGPFCFHSGGLSAVPTLSEVLSRYFRLPFTRSGARRRRGLPGLAEP